MQMYLQSIVRQELILSLQQLSAYSYDSKIVWIEKQKENATANFSLGYSLNLLINFNKNYIFSKDIIC